MKSVASLVAIVLCFAVPDAALAQPRVIGDLSQGALLGQIRDTAQLQNDFSSQHTLLAEANTRLGLSPSDFRTVEDAIAHGRARYVEIPRHLDGMAGQYHGRAFAVHNIVIPAHVYGWEVDVNHPTALVRVFMPNRCGNMSYLLVPRRSVVAAAPIRTPAPLIAAAPPVVETPLPAPTPMPVAVVAPVVPVAPAAAVHHFAILPWLALGLIGIAFMHGSHSSSPIGVPPGVVATPLPIHTVCPNP